MKKTLLFAMALFMGTSISVKAGNTDISTLDNVIYIEPVTAEAGTEVTLSVKMKNKVQAEGFGFDLYLPEGISFKLDADGFPEAYLSTKRTTARKTNTFESAIQANGSLRVFAASTNGSVINGNDGEVAAVTIIISADMTAGTYTLLLKEIAISDVDAVSHDAELVETSITITNPASVLGIDNGTQGNVPLYNLEGQQVQNTDTKGVYIQKGRKFVSK
jgi:hypothetical protein